MNDGTESTQKRVFELRRGDLGKKIRYEYDGDSVSVGILESVTHAQGRMAAWASMTIDGTNHQVRDATATVSFIDS